MPDKVFDIVVIGSGAGGGTVAQALAPLARDGRSIAVLEAGPNFKEEDFTGREVEMANRLYFEGGGMLTRDRTMTLAMGKVLGGSTVVYTGTSLLIQKPTLQRWGVRGLDFEDLSRRADRYVEENNVHFLDKGLINDNNRLFEEGCRALGWKAEQFPLNIRGCKGSSLCNLGCPNRAKQGTHRVQLPAARKEGVELVWNCVVETIEERSLEATVRSAPIGEPSPWEPGRYRIKAKIIVLCANAVHSPALLLRSGFGEALPALGRGFTCHPALFMVAQHETSLSNFYGHPKSYYCDQFQDTDEFLLETCMYFPFTTAKNLSGFGKDHSALMSDMSRLQMILALADDPAKDENRVTLDREGKALVDYRLGPEVIRSLVAAQRASAKIFFAAGAQRMHAPSAGRFFIEAHEKDRVDALISEDRFLPGKISVTAAHLMGGCRMGDGPSNSVTDAWGRVHGVPWLFVADSSLFPQASRINPYLTIMALADRVAQKIREEAPALLAEGAAA